MEVIVHGVGGGGGGLICFLCRCSERKTAMSTRYGCSFFWCNVYKAAMSVRHGYSFFWCYIYAKQPCQQDMGTVFLFRTILPYIKDNYYTLTVFLKTNLKGLSLCCMASVFGLWVMSVLGFIARMNHPLICCLSILTRLAEQICL